ncbi:cellobiose phosphorylase [Chengkuizengella axinellae]|uniref:Cellobiose phosphorylase n=1 Tax=Chengkuizengella axinellae TaxID=3064388 RepID=A0ABT9J0K4_9BACL|nr:cellobiose phosphorylase [Chengkuizengella sp. 2205SS18-9]MDP5275156.1 cellobiose phosphorylase [Chengkuizengella sp. 2205SS18-9]
MKPYFFDEQKRFVIRDYNNQKPFSSFFPGIAGTMGIPIWAFYVNRGQGIASFGVQNKDSSIMEFFPANKSYQQIPTTGFRTFIKYNKGEKKGYYEPFTYQSGDLQLDENMYISSNLLEIDSTNKETGLQVSVSYYTLPNESFASLVRTVKIKNISEEKVKCEVLDGMPSILPYGITEEPYKRLGHTLKSWMDVYNLDQGIPFYKLRGDTADSAAVGEIKGGYFYLSFDDDNLISPIVDANLVFGMNTSFNKPDVFLKNSLGDLLSQQQVTTNKVPTGFSGLEKELQPGQSVEINTMIGFVHDIEQINSRKDELSQKSYIDTKRNEAQQLVEELTNDIATKTSSSLFDAYCKQNYLDNLLRGGYPVTFEAGDKSLVYHIYSRKHGDLERDYNFFSLEAGYYSQGNGNFRDANQNRRSDVLFHPEIEDFNVNMFFNLMQTDGYNPLVVKGCSFTVKQDQLDMILKFVHDNDKNKITTFFTKPYTPGELLTQIGNRNIKLEVSEEQFLLEALQISEQHVEAEFGEGYWVDHWTYNMDLVDSYLAIYPDRLHEMLFDKQTYTYFDSPAIVLPREDKYVLVDGKVRQYDAIEEDAEKESMLHARTELPNWVRTKFGEGDIYYTNLYSKAVSLALNKFATLDPYGLGVEMEANKPGWNDSMNGLPGLFASGFSEASELKRLLQFVISSSEGISKTIKLPVEMADLLKAIEGYLDTYNASEQLDKDYQYWDQVSTAREQYREKTKYGIDGAEAEFEVSEIVHILNKFVNKMNEGMKRALELNDGKYPTYFYFEADSYEQITTEDGKQKLNKNHLPNVKVTKFKLNNLPQFLEGPTRALKVLDSFEEKQKLYQQIKNSGVYDKKLKMYKVNASLEEESFELGRVRAFTPGWLENESVFMHMEYKYILEVLKAGLYDEFFEDMQNVMVPFLDPEVYGRSILENSSFIASSANPDVTQHGTGFVARLSGSTAEFLSIWYLMMANKQPFQMEDGKLSLKLKPILPGWLFDENGTVQFNFLSKCDVTYINKSGKNTFGADGVQVNKFVLTTEDGEQVTIEDHFVPDPYASMVREGKIIKIDAYLA